MMKKLLVLFCILILSGCADKNPNPDEVLGFFFGFVHGFIVVFAFIASWFDHNISLYASNNDGFWYNFGYVIGLHVFFNVKLRVY
jgi:hypothetical protein